MISSKFRLRRRFGSTGLLALATLAPAAFLHAADEPAVATSPAVSAEALVEQLGDVDYATREAAAEDLKTLGFQAEKALEVGTEHADLEIRLRSRHILERLRKDAVEKRLASFLADPASVMKEDLPGWAALEAAVGAARPARETYVAIHRRRPETLQAVAKGPDAAKAELARLSRDLQFATQLRSPDTEELVATLLLDESAGDETSFERVALIHNLLSNIQLQQTIGAEPDTTPAMRLLKRWVQRDPGEPIRQYKLRIAMQYGFGPEALDLSRKTLVSNVNSRSSDPVATAMLAVGRYGTAEDAANLVPYLDDDEICHTWFNGAAQSIKIQVRDVATAVTLHLHGQDPKTFGFEFAQRDDDSLFAIYTLGFEEDDDRGAALRKFAQWAETSGAVELPESFHAAIPKPSAEKSPGKPRADDELPAGEVEKRDEASDPPKE